MFNTFIEGTSSFDGTSSIEGTSSFDGTSSIEGDCSISDGSGAIRISLIDGNIHLEIVDNNFLEVAPHFFLVALDVLLVSKRFERLNNAVFYTIYITYYRHIIILYITLLYAYIIILYITNKKYFTMEVIYTHYLF